MSKEFNCAYCILKFGSKASLYRHRNEAHVNALQIRKASQCGVCNFSCRGQVELCKHVTVEHGTTCHIQQRNFQSEAEYETWREDVEKSGSFKFYLRSSFKSEKATTLYLHCFRSGSFQTKSQGKRAPKALTTNKIDFTCSAYAKVHLYSNAEQGVDVEFCIDHYGHDDTFQRLPLSKDHEQRIVQMIVDGFDTEHIVNSQRNEIEVDSCGHVKLGKHNLLSKTNVDTMKKKFGLKAGQKNQCDDTSVQLWVEELRSRDYLLYYNENRDNFGIGIQTKFQRTLLQNYHKNVICVDSTHGTTQYNFKLFTILVVNKFGRGVPAAWFITSSESEQNLLPFFMALREKLGNLQPRFFMSDDAPAFYNAWSRVFGSASTQKLLCVWHVQSNWVKNVRKYVKNSDKKIENFQQKSIRCHLRSLIREPDAEAFENSLKLLLFLLEKEFNQGSFLDYFKTTYCSTESRIKEWSAVARKTAIVNTNMFIESYHKKLKYSPIYLNGRQNRRLDCLLHTLTIMADNDFKQHFIDKHTVSPSTWRQSLMNDRHRRSKLLNAELLQIVNDQEWALPSEKRGEQFYTIKRNNHICDCSLKCRECFVCPFAYTCSCIDSTITKAACKHIHLVQQTVSGRLIDQPATTTISSIDDAEIVKDMIVDVGQAKLDYKERAVDLWNFILKNNDAFADKEIGAEIVQKLTEIKNRISLKRSTRIFPTPEPNLGRRIQPQLRLDRFTNCKKRRTTDGSSLTVEEQNDGSKLIEAAAKRLKNVLPHVNVFK